MPNVMNAASPELLIINASNLPALRRKGLEIKLKALWNVSIWVAGGSRLYRPVARLFCNCCWVIMQSAGNTFIDSDRFYIAFICAAVVLRVQKGHIPHRYVRFYVIFNVIGQYICLELAVFVIKLTRFTFLLMSLQIDVSTLYPTIFFCGYHERFFFLQFDSNITKKTHLPFI